MYWTVLYSIIVLICQKHILAVNSLSGNDEVSILAKGWKNGILEAHNKARRIHDVPEVTWNKTAAAFAKGWCKKLAKKDQFQHSPKEDRPFSMGENLFKKWTTSKELNILSLGEDSVGSFYREIKFWDFQTSSKKAGSEGEVTGHFTQVVWKDTESVGCGFAAVTDDPDTKLNTVVICCNYSPPGNVQGKYHEQVPVNIGCLSDSQTFCPSDNSCREEESGPCPCSWQIETEGECVWTKGADNGNTCGGQDTVARCECESCVGQQPPDEHDTCTEQDCQVGYLRRFQLGVSDVEGGRGTVLLTDPDSNTYAVCNDRFGDVEAGVICRLLGYTYGTATQPDKKDKNLLLQFAITHLRCPIGVSDLEGCSYDVYGRSYIPCFPGEEAAVACSNQVFSLEIRSFTYWINNKGSNGKIKCDPVLKKYNVEVNYKRGPITGVFVSKLLLQRDVIESTPKFTVLATDRLTKKLTEEDGELGQDSCLVCVAYYGRDEATSREPSSNLAAWKYNKQCKEKVATESDFPLI